MSSAPPRLRVLCVDDEPQVLAGLSDHLGRKYQVLLASSGAEALKALEATPDVAVVMSDMRMPGMNGAEFLARANEVAPDAVRMLLTGQTDTESAIAAVNQGHIWRFLAKPCPPTTLAAAMESAVAQHRLILAERQLLEQTLKGSIKALTDVLALSNPAAFGRATRVKTLVTGLVGALAFKQTWQIEIAAMVSQLGFIALPGETLDKAYDGRPLTAQEQDMVARVPALTDQLLSNIPRLEVVRAMLALCAGEPLAPSLQLAAADRALADKGARVLRLAIDFDSLELRATKTPGSLEVLRGRGGKYDPELIAALVNVSLSPHHDCELRELPVSALRVGMRFESDMRLRSGILMVARGYEVTTGLVERIRNFEPGTVLEPVRVWVPKVPSTVWVG